MSESAECGHCQHFHDWPPEPDEEGIAEPYGDPGDGLGAEGFCCDCGASQEKA